jgi:hypothetical protein
MRRWYKLEILSMLKLNEDLGFKDPGEWRDGYIDLDSILTINFDSWGSNSEPCCAITVTNGEGFVINKTVGELYNLIITS